MNKVYDRIYWSNNTTPALNATNLNAMSKGIDDIDQRVVELAGAILETVPQLQEMIEDVETLSENPPYIGANGDWYVWDTETGEYKDSGIDASITVTIADVTAIAPDAQPYVTNTGTNTDPIFHLFIPKGQKGDDGTDGNDGVSPTVTITSIAGGHRVTITDADHPSGQSFDVMDGAGAGDMKASVYDSNSAVANAGGISAFVTAAISALATVARTGAYSDLTGLPTIPTVNNATLNIQQNGVSKGTFTANASADASANIITDEWTASATQSNGTVVFDNLDPNYGYKLCFDDEGAMGDLTIPNSSAVNKTTGTQTGTIKLTYTVDGTDGSSKYKLRILK